MTHMTYMTYMAGMTWVTSIEVSDVIRYRARRMSPSR